MRHLPLKCHLGPEEGIAPDQLGTQQGRGVHRPAGLRWDLSGWNVWVGGGWSHSQPCRCDNIDDYKDVAGSQTWLKPGIPVAENGLKVGFHRPSQGSWQGAGREFFRCSPEISHPQTHHLLGVGRNQWCHIPPPQPPGRPQLPHIPLPPP